MSFGSLMCHARAIVMCQQLQPPRSKDALSNTTCISSLAILTEYQSSR